MTIGAVDKIKPLGAFKVIDASDVEETSDAKVMTAAEREKLASNPAQRGPSTTDSWTALDRRRRRGAGLSHDGKVFDAAQVALEYVSAAKVRIKRFLGGAAIDLNGDGSIDFNGGQLVNLADPTADGSATPRRYVAQQMTAASAAALAASPIQRQSGIAAYAWFILDKRRRVGGSLSADGKTFEAASVAVDYVNAAKSRVRRKAGGASIDLNSDGSIELAGDKRAASASTVQRAVLGQRRRAIEVLYADGRYAVAKALFKPTATGFVLTGVDGTPIITQDGPTVTHHGATSSTPTPAPAAARIDYYPVQPVAAPAPARAGNVYRHGMGQILPSAVDRSRLANWGSSSMDSGHFGTQLAAIASKYGIPNVYVGGVGSDEVEHILARMGARPALLTLPGNMIPAGTTEIDVTVSNMPFRQGFRDTEGTLGGVTGRFRSVTGGTSYTWRRTTAGDAVPISADTPLLPTLGAANRSAVSILNIGKNSVNDYSAAQLFAFTNLAYDFLAPLQPWTIVINHFVNPGGANKATILALNALTAARYGPVHVDQYSFICKGLPQFGQTVWQLTGIAPTQSDLDAQARGEVPPSLSDGGVHTNAAGSSALQWLVEQTIDQLGWFAA